MTVRKFSRKREAILDAIRSTSTHPTAEWIYASLKDNIPDLSLGTVYRNIALFKAEGLVRVVGVVGGQERFDGDTATHSHFICNTCGSIFDIKDVPGQISDSRVEAGYGVKVERHEVVFYGTCATCKTTNIQR